MIKRHLNMTASKRTEATIAITENNLPKIGAIAVSKGDGSLLGGFVNSGYEKFSLTNMLNYEHERQVHFLKIIGDFGAANFNCVLNNGKLFSFTVNGETYEMMGSHHSSYTDAHKWLDCLYAAIAVRNEEAINILMQIPNTVFDKAAVKVDPITYALADVYKGLFGGIQDRSMLELISTAYSVADADEADRLEYIMSNMIPQLGIIRTILSSNSEDEYNKLMKEAVLTHKDYWSQDEYEYEGWVSLPLIALASIAFDHKGYRLNFETDYIPRWLVEREFS